MADHVDHILAQWRQERPDLDLSAMAEIARIQRVTRFLEHDIESLLIDYDVNLPGFGVLTALLRSGPPYRLTPTALYDSLLISSGAMTNRLDRLSAAGLVDRVPAENDRRSMLVALTPEGKRLTNTALTAHTEQEQELISCLTPAERKAITTLLRKVLETFEDRPTPESNDGRSARQRQVLSPSSRRH